MYPKRLPISPYKHKTSLHFLVSRVCLLICSHVYWGAQVALPNDIVKELFCLQYINVMNRKKNMFALANFYCLYLMDYINAFEWMKNVVCDTKNFFLPFSGFTHIAIIN
jgi:hypothetical protein